MHFGRSGLIVLESLSKQALPGATAHEDMIDRSLLGADGKIMDVTFRVRREGKNRRRRRKDKLIGIYRKGLPTVT